MVVSNLDVLLFGQSPFIGDNDDETLQNVLRGEYSIKGPLADNDQISSVAKTFVENLLILDPLYVTHKSINMI